MGPSNSEYSVQFCDIALSSVTSASLHCGQSSLKNFIYLFFKDIIVNKKRIVNTVLMEYGILIKDQSVWP